MDESTDRRRALHRVRQPDVQRELSRFANRAAENQQRDERRACAKQGQTGAFETSEAAIVKKQCAIAIVEPEHSEKKSHVTDARGDECFLCGRCRARSLDPEADE